MSPTEELMTEVLAARYRLGEHCWTFSSRLTPAARSLEAAGLVTWKGGIIEKTIRVWLTDAGRAESLGSDYASPAAGQHIAHQEAVLSSTGYGDTSEHVLRADGLRARIRDLEADEGAAEVLADLLADLRGLADRYSAMPLDQIEILLARYAPSDPTPKEQP